MTDFGIEAQKAAEAHLEACQEAQWDEDGEETDGESSPASAPFCGCNTCIVREVLHAAWPILIDQATEEMKAMTGELVDEAMKRNRGYKKALEEIIAFGNAGSSRHRARLALADVGDAEAEDQHQGGGDDREHDVTEGDHG